MLRRSIAAVFRHHDIILGAAGTLVLCIFWWICLKEAGQSAMFFDCPPNDGCFQIANPLRRLAAGQSLGSDFMFFYGPGSILLHYPLFSAYGADLLASELARLLMTPLAFMTATFVFLRALLRRPGLALFLTGAACWSGGPVPHHGRQP